MEVVKRKRKKYPTVRLLNQAMVDTGEISVIPLPVA
jgi:hypothetical protein